MLACAGIVGCARAGSGLGDRGGDAGVGGNGSDGAVDLGVVGGGGDLAGSAIDMTSGGAGVDLASADLASAGVDLGSGGGADLASAPDLASGGGLIGGGPCASGAAGATAIRVRWTNAAGEATVGYEAFGMPDPSRQQVGAYGCEIGFTPEFVDQPLGGGGLLLDDDDFVDIELSGAGLTTIDHATIAVFGRSYDTTASGSFNWESFSDSGQTATNFVSNVAPYRWYAADLGNSVAAGDANVLVRVKAGGSSDALVVSRLEVCLAAH